MLPIPRASSPDFTSPPLSPSTERLQSKIDGLDLGFFNTTEVNWNGLRLVTPGNAVGIKSDVGINLVDGSILLFIKENDLQNPHPDSQGIFYDVGKVLGASVTTAIHAVTDRRQETKPTFVQYDRDRFDTINKDFSVTERRSPRGKINYEGGHLIDYKFSAGSSHTCPENYFPQHHKVNSPLKEYVIQRSSEYVEIILSTPNPPTIGVKGLIGVSQNIPVGDLLIQINGGNITSVYYFPNNNFDYQRLEAAIPGRRTISEKLLPYFKLKPCYHALLQAAIITDFRNNPLKKEQQSSSELRFLNTIDQLSDGMGLLSSGPDNEELVELASRVFHEGAHVPPSLLLDCTEAQLRMLEGQPIALPHKELAEFLVKYAWRNALKSEVISINTRLIFLNSIIDFIENSDKITNSVLEFVNSLAEEFERSFDELDRLMQTMTPQELLFFANTLSRYSSPYNQEFFKQTHPICFMEMEYCHEKFISVLKFISDKYNVRDLIGDDAQNFLRMVLNAHDNTAFWIVNGSREDVLEEINSLKTIRDFCIAMYPRLSVYGKSHVTYQSNIKRTTFSRSCPNYLEGRIYNIGRFGDDESSSSSETDESSSSESSDDSDEWDPFDSTGSSESSESSTSSSTSESSDEYDSSHSDE